MLIDEFIEGIKHLAETIFHDPHPTVESAKANARIILQLVQEVERKTTSDT